MDRNALVAELADQIRDAVRAGDRWRADYSALMATTGRKRSWCEKVVHAARTAVLEVPARTDDDDDDRTNNTHTAQTRTANPRTEAARTASAPA